MNQTLASIFTLFLSVAVITSCGEKEQGEKTIKIVRPVKTLVIQSPETGGQRSFPGRVEAANRATLSFQVAGKLNEILVKEGEEVKAGQTLARLDPKDFKVVVNDRSANYHRAAADFKRAKELMARL